MLYFSSGNFLKLEVYHEEIKTIKKIEKPAYLVRDDIYTHFLISVINERCKHVAFLSDLY